MTAQGASRLPDAPSVSGHSLLARSALFKDGPGQLQRLFAAVVDIHSIIRENSALEIRCDLRGNLVQLRRSPVIPEQVVWIGKTHFATAIAFIICNRPEDLFLHCRFSGEPFWRETVKERSMRSSAR